MNLILSKIISIIKKYMKNKIKLIKIYVNYRN
jgi:hypothetical protein